MEDSKLRELQEELSSLRKFVSAPGFEVLTKDVNEQLQERLSRLILDPPAGIDDMVKKCYMMGECAGLKLSLNLTSIKIEMLEMDIRNATKTEGNDE